MVLDAVILGIISQGLVLVILLFLAFVIKGIEMFNPKSK